MNRRLFLLPVVLAAWCGTVAAEPSSRVAWTPNTLAVVKNADSARGQTLAQSCNGCHAGNAMPGAPHLDGQLATYLYRQLRDFKDGSRAGAVMPALVTGLSDSDMAALAAWYGQQQPPAATPGKSNTNLAERLANRGDNQRLIPACAACHGGDGAGKAQDIPRLAGQDAAYLEAALQAYKSGQRHNDVYRRMRNIAANLSAQEIRQLAAYYAGLE